MDGIKISTPLLEIPGIGPRFIKYLGKLGIKTVRDLLWHFPARYEDFSQIYRIADLEPGEHVTVQGVITEIKLRRSWRRHMAIVEATLEDDSGRIKAIWFNQPYILNALRRGKRVNLAGKVAVSDEDIYLSHPVYEAVGREETKHTARLVPIYPETRGLTSKGIRFLMRPLLKNTETLEEWLPPQILKNQGFPEINRALKDTHFPEKIEDAAAAQKRFSFENLFLLQLANLEQKLKLAKEKAAAITADIPRLRQTIAELPFALTFSQKKSLWEIIKDMAKGRPMNRLLQGDVGSGKTVVAVLAALVAAENGLQTAFMAPTEILAGQHFETMKKLLAGIKAPHQPPVAILTSGAAKTLYENDVLAESGPERLREELAAGRIKIIIGTHSLIQKTVKFQNLGLVVVDEQHRFGVRQRAALADRRQTRSALVPHFLSMSATPIPRTLMLTVFGDLDISLITELPIGRKSIITKIVPPEERKSAYGFVRKEIGNGRQAFVICPRIEPGDAKNTGASGLDARNASGPFVPKPDFSGQLLKLLELKSVKEEYEKLSKKIFPDLRVAMLHGRLKSKEKERVIGDFVSGRADILVSTSVVEVGVDIPNATIMMIEGSERFGLAQLYQFRGRVGRGGHQSYCFLMSGAGSAAKTAKERLKAIIEAKNGFELAERDLKLRGPGEFLGETQTGFPDVAMAGLQDAELVKASREAAAAILKNDPRLNRYPLLSARLKQFEAKIHLE